MSKKGKIIFVTCSEKFMKSISRENPDSTYANNMLSLRSIRMTPVNAIVLAILKVYPIDPHIVFVAVLLDIIVQVQNIVT